MGIIEKIYSVLAYEIESPESYGIFHLISLAVIICTTVMITLKFKDCSEATERRIAKIFLFTLVALEIYKQVIFAIEFDDGKLVFDYAWYAFPFQFCSSPMYVLPFIAFMKNGKVRDAAISFMATFSLFAGIAVAIYPNDVFMQLLGIDIQTMVHHGSQIVLGVFFAARRLNSHFPVPTKRHFIGALSVFSVLSAVAMILNISVYNVFAANGIDDTFNMFFISPYFDCTLPVLSIFYGILPYPAFLLTYLIGFAIVALIMIGLVAGAAKIFGKRK